MYRYLYVVTDLGVQTGKGFRVGGFLTSPKQVWNPQTLVFRDPCKIDRKFRGYIGITHKQLKLKDPSGLARGVVAARVGSWIAELPRCLFYIVNEGYESLDVKYRRPGLQFDLDFNTKPWIRVWDAGDICRSTINLRKSQTFRSR